MGSDGPWGRPRPSLHSLLYSWVGSRIFRKAPPDHDRIRVLHSFQCEFAVTPVGANGLSHLDPVALMQQKMDSSEYMTVDKSTAFQCWYCMQKASLFFFIFSVKRGLKAGTLLGIFRCFWRPNWTLWSVREASSGTVCLSWPAVMPGYFLICLFRASNTSSVIFLGLLEPFFRERMPLSVVAFKAAKTQLRWPCHGPAFQRYLSWTILLLCRPEQKPYLQSKGFSPYVRSYLTKTSPKGFVIDFRRCLWWFWWLDWQVWQLTIIQWLILYLSMQLKCEDDKK